MGYFYMWKCGELCFFMYIYVEFVVSYASTHICGSVVSLASLQLHPRFSGGEGRDELFGFSVVYCLQ